MKSEWDEMAPWQQAEMLAYSQIRDTEEAEQKSSEINALLGSSGGI